MEKLIVLGTGNAGATRCYNTCFILLDGKEPLLVDAGGGNAIVSVATLVLAIAGMIFQFRHLPKRR